MKTVAAIYEDGIFRPKNAVTLSPGAEVEVIIPDDRDPVAIMKERFPRSFGSISNEDAEEMMRIIEEDCGRVDDEREMTELNHWR